MSSFSSMRHDSSHGEMSGTEMSDRSLSLFEKVLPAGSATELLKRLAEAISAEAFFVRRRRWPIWLGVRPWCDDAQQVLFYHEEDIPKGGRQIGSAIVIGAVEPIDEPAVALLAAQIQLLDDRMLDEKLESMAELAAGAGHEVNNPLGSIVGRAKLLLKDETDPERRQTLAAIATQAYRGRDMIGDLMLFARPPAPKPECVVVEAAINEVLRDLSEQLETHSVKVSGRRDASTTVWADATQLRIVLSELLLNAARFAPAGSSVELTTERYEHDTLITVTDLGSPMSDLERRHLFDPFYSGRQAGRGLGFGLTKCWRIVLLHGGAITSDDAGGRNRFLVRWPIGPG